MLLNFDQQTLNVTWMNNEYSAKFNASTSSVLSAICYISQFRAQGVFY